MQRKHLNVDGGIGGQCKIRKRGSSSSSSSSFLLRNYRLKRAILVGKKAGSSTPVPMWKMNISRSPSLKNDKIIAVASKEGEVVGKELVVSARKLAATLWEINGVSTARVKNNVENSRKAHEVEWARKDKILESSSKVASNPLYCSGPSFSPLSEKMDQLQEGTHRSRDSSGSQKLLPYSDCKYSGFASFHNAGFVEVDRTHGCMPLGNKVKRRLKELRGAVTSSQELLKLLNNISHLEGQPPTTLSLVSSLKTEIDRACVLVNKLIHEHRSNQHEIDFLLQQFKEEKATWKVREREQIRGAISSIAGELELERKLKGQSERLNKKLGKELAETKASLSKATKEVEREKKAREILEQVCDELAQGIGEDRTIVAELTRESAKVREEVEKEREMLHIADLLREERVQMKLLEAKYQFEEKNAIVDELKNQLEAYLKTKVDGGEQGTGSPNYERIKELEKYLRETLPVPTHYHDPEKNAGEFVFKEDQGEAEDSPDSDLHSIELNIDDHTKSFIWNDVNQVDTNKMAMNDKSKGRKSTSSEKRQRKSISIERQTSDGLEWEFSPAARHIPSDVFDGSSKVFDFSSKDWKRECDDEIERYNMIKNLRDSIVSGSKIASSHEASGPKERWDQHNLASQNLSKVVCEAFGVLQEAV